MNEQLLFDTALAHIRKQGKPSVWAKGCAYRGPEGLQCAFGPAIEYYTPAMEGTSAGGLLRRYNTCIKEDFREIDRHFADDLQDAHDNAAMDRGDFMENFEANMALLAEMENVNYDTPSN